MLGEIKKLKDLMKGIMALKDLFAESVPVSAYVGSSKNLKYLKLRPTVLPTPGRRGLMGVLRNMMS